VHSLVVLPVPGVAWGECQQPRLTVCGRQAGAASCWLPGGSGEVGGDDVCGVPVQAAAGPIVPDRGPGIGVGGGFLHVAQRHPGIQRGGDEGVPERVRADGLADPGTADDPADDPPGAMPV
jgi:hypothetical protein